MGNDEAQGLTSQLEGGLLDRVKCCIEGLGTAVPGFFKGGNLLPETGDGGHDVRFLIRRSLLTSRTAASSSMRAVCTAPVFRISCACRQARCRSRTAFCFLPRLASIVDFLLLTCWE